MEKTLSLETLKTDADTLLRLLRHALPAIGYDAIGDEAEVVELNSEYAVMVFSFRVARRRHDV